MSKTLALRFLPWQDPQKSSPTGDSRGPRPGDISGAPQRAWTISDIGDPREKKRAGNFHFCGMKFPDSGLPARGFPPVGFSPPAIDRVLLVSRSSLHPHSPRLPGGEAGQRRSPAALVSQECTSHGFAVLAPRASGRTCTLGTLYALATRPTPGSLCGSRHQLGPLLFLRGGWESLVFSSVLALFREKFFQKGISVFDFPSDKRYPFMIMMSSVAHIRSSSETFFQKFSPVTGSNKRGSSGFRGDVPPRAGAPAFILHRPPPPPFHKPL